MRTVVAPSSTASSKSSLIPMESSGRPRERASSRSAAKCGRVRPGGGIVIRPRSSRAGSARTAATSPGTSAGETPAFVASPPVFTSTRTLRRLPAWAAARSSRSARSAESTVSTIPATRAARLALFDWTGPIRWPTQPAGSEGNFASASWTRFSPKWRTPASNARRRSSTGRVFVTATSVTAAGSRPTLDAARAIRSLTRTTAAATSPARLTARRGRSGRAPRSPRRRPRGSGPSGRGRR